MIEITSSPIDHAAVTERVRADHAGAVCTFLGTVRDLTGDRKTLALRYEAYPEMALKKLAELETEARHAGRSSSWRWCTGSAIWAWRDQRRRRREHARTGTRHSTPVAG